MTTSIFIFRRDLRLYDNIGFINCIKNSKHVLPIFIFNPMQIDASLEQNHSFERIFQIIVFNL